MMELIVTAGLVVGISAICSLFEAVLYAVPLGHIESLVAAGSRTGRILQRLRRDVDRPIAAILSLNTIANTAGAAVAGAMAASIFGQAWLVYFSALLTLTILVFSEIIPKTAGVTYSRSLAPLVARPLQALVWLFTPLIWVTRKITGIMTRGREKHQVSAEELIVMARLGHKTGGIEEDEVKVIQGILSLATKTVRDIMTPRTVVFSLSADLTVAQIHTQVGTLNHSQVPVFDKDVEDIVGMIHRRDVLQALAEGRSEVKLDELMRPIDFVADSLALDELLALLLERRQHLFAVCNEFGELCGLVALEDVLEEILGEEIVDEFDEVADMRELAHRRRKQPLSQKRRV